MADVKIVDNIMKFVAKNHLAMDRALGRMAVDIERLSKMQVPHDKGQLKSSGRHRKVGPLNWIVEYKKVYAAFQEFGGDGKRVVRHYSKPGKKKFYLKDPGVTIVKKAMSYIKQEANSVKV